MGNAKKEMGVLLRLPPEVQGRVAACSAETGRSVHELILEAVQRAFVSWSGGVEEDAAAERDALRAENERLRARLKALSEDPRLRPPVEAQKIPLIAPRRVSPEEQDKALQEAQRRLEALREQRANATPTLPPTPEDLGHLRELEAQLPRVASELMSSKHRAVDAQRRERQELISRGRIEGVAYEEAEGRQRVPRAEKTRPAPHASAVLEKATPRPPKQPAAPMPPSASFRQPATPPQQPRDPERKKP